MTKRYAKPPIIEAVCEFRLTPECTWDLTIPGLIYEEVRNNFPIKEQSSVQELESSQGGPEARPQTRTTERILFLTSDRKTFIQVGPRLLAINTLRLYPSWKGFKPKIEIGFRALTKKVEVQGLQRIGLRYINLIEVPGKSFNLIEFFDFRPLLGERLRKRALSGLIVGCLLPSSDGHDVTKVQLMNTGAAKEDATEFLLDIDHFTARAGLVSPDQAMQWVEKAHEQVEEVFEDCITEKLRETFEELP